MHEFLGKKFDNPQTKKFLNEFFISYNIEEDEQKKTYSFGINYGLPTTKYTLSTEEIFAMLFRYIRFLSAKFSQSEVKECLVTVPSFFGYKERLSLANAVDIAGLKLLHLITENTGATVNYAMNTKFTKETVNVIFYNMGASYTQATLASFRSRYELHPNDKNKTVEHQYIKVIDETWDENLGGRNFDYNIVRHFLKSFYEKNSRNDELNFIRNFYEKNNLQFLDSDNEKLKLKISKTAERILPSAIKYKEILSANKEVNVQILGVEDGLNLSGILTRTEFEQFSIKDFERVYLPVTSLLERNNMNIDDISQVEFIGGGSRIPMIKEIFKKYIPVNKIGNHMNGDDAVALGAAFISSNITKSSSFIYNNKKTDLVEYGTNYEIKIKLINDNSSSLCIDNAKEIAENCVRKINKETKLFKARTGFTTNKFVNFKHDSDFNVIVYQIFNYTNTETEIMTFKVKTSNLIKKILSQEKGFTKTIPKIYLKFIHDNVGTISMNAELNYDILYYLAMFKDAKGKYSFKYTTEYQEPIGAIDLIYEIEKINQNKDYTKAEKDRIIKRLKSEVGTNKTEYKKQDIEVITEFSYPLPIDRTQIIKSRVLLNRFDSIDEFKRLNDEKKNILETLLYAKREWIESDQGQLYATESEIVNFKQKINEIANWYDNEGFKENAEVITKKIDLINSIFSPFENRIELNEKRKIAVEYFHSEMNSTFRVAENLARTKYWLQNYINGEFTEKLNSLYDWIYQKLNDQNKIPLYENAVLTSDEIYKKLDVLKLEIGKLRKMPRPIEEI